MKSPVVLFLAGMLLAACSSPKAMDASGFPLEQGTTRVYTYEAYDPSPADPEQIVKATYQLTETVVETQTISNYTVAHVKRDRALLQADPGWTQDITGQPNEVWYVKSDQQIFQSNFPLHAETIRLEDLILDYEFPLSLRKSWCLLPDSRSNTGDVGGCDFVGKRQVTGRGRYETPAGSFENCYDLQDSYNGGNILQKVCDGVGIVFMKFDHIGTRFGFEQTLIRFSRGTP